MIGKSQVLFLAFTAFRTLQKSDIFVKTMTAAHYYTINSIMKEKVSITLIKETIRKCQLSLAVSKNWLESKIFSSHEKLLLISYKCNIIICWLFYLFFKIIVKGHRRADL